MRDVLWATMNIEYKFIKVNQATRCLSQTRKGGFPVWSPGWCTGRPRHAGPCKLFVSVIRLVSQLFGQLAKSFGELLCYLSIIRSVRQLFDQLVSYSASYSVFSQSFSYSVSRSVSQVVSLVPYFKSVCQSLAQSATRSVSVHLLNNTINLFKPEFFQVHSLHFCIFGLKIYESRFRPL